MNLKSIKDFTNHLIHVIQESEGIQLSDKSKSDIMKTLNGYAKESIKGSLSNMEYWRKKYYELDKQHADLKTELHLHNKSDDELLVSDLHKVIEYANKVNDGFVKLKKKAVHTNQPFGITTQQAIDNAEKMSGLSMEISG